MDETTATTEIENTEVEFAVEDYFTEDTYTPYAVCKVVNKVFKDLGYDKELPPQMFYIYAKKGMLGNEKNTKVITAEQATQWLEKYLVKHFS